jgi:hypothetical protein
MVLKQLFWKGINIVEENAVELLAELGITLEVLKELNN